MGSENGFMRDIIDEVLSSPINIVLLAICGILIYKIYKISYGDNRESPAPAQPSIPKLKKQDMTLEQLRQYDGKGEHGRICVAINFKIFDMTKGARFYGPGGPYAAFAGHDATHALATFNMDDIKNESRDLSNLTSAQMESVREWEMQFTEKYDYIGKLIKDGEQPTEYSDDDDSSKDSVNSFVDLSTESVEDKKEI